MSRAFLGDDALELVELAALGCFDVHPKLLKVCHYIEAAHTEVVGREVDSGGEVWDSGQDGALECDVKLGGELDLLQPLGGVEPSVNILASLGPLELLDPLAEGC